MKTPVSDANFWKFYSRWESPVVRPITSSYKYVLPQPMREAVARSLAFVLDKPNVFFSHMRGSRSAAEIHLQLQSRRASRVANLKVKIQRKRISFHAIFRFPPNQFQIVYPDSIIHSHPKERFSYDAMHASCNSLY